MILLALSIFLNRFHLWADGGHAAGCPSARVPLCSGSLPAAASAAAAPSLGDGMGFNAPAACSGSSAQLRVLIQRHFRRKAPSRFAAYFPCQPPGL